MLFFKLFIISVCASLLYFALGSGVGIVETLKFIALGTVCSVAVSAVYPEIRGVKEGDPVSLVTESSTPGIFGKLGTAAADGRKNEEIKIILGNGTEVVGVIESYFGIISPPKVRVLYEERLVD